MTAESVRETASELLAASARVSPPTIREVYVLLQFCDRPYAFSRIDAVYVWTEGGYQVARNPDDYPLFVAVREDDIEAWEGFFSSYDIPTGFERQPRESIAGPLQVVLDPCADLDVEVVEGRPVVPREETIEYMYAHHAHFQGLSMLDRMYDDLELDEPYRERERARPCVSRKEVTLSSNSSTI